MSMTVGAGGASRPDVPDAAQTVQTLQTLQTMEKGRLYLVPAPLDFGCASLAALDQVLPAATLQTAARLGHWVCENAKSTRAYLKRVHALYPLASALQQQQIVELPHQVHKKGDHDHTSQPGGDGESSGGAPGAKGAPAFDAGALLAPALAGQDMGLVSEAGMPAVADPGSSLVRAAHDLGVGVYPLVGPAALLLALAASGLNGQQFAFAGYLPQDAQRRSARIRELEAVALKTGQTQLFIETPYRNAALWQALVQTLQPHTRLVQASALTLPQAQVRSQLVRQWRQQPASAPDKNSPTVFAFGR